ncbi:GNL3L/Grn1 putative GTPase [Nitzschia inconspicua]|uniref:GNL3L/Grn1 putative GTPase n=1 Tax=Nitzschia inconspicua TaxID=303405 RepID=A0A9K3PK08_9STRA|nr:GNL3L/Grn1 putative GTPase [Nitzschia inconspicua]
MVKKKGKSKRTTLKDKYKIQRRVAETHRKRKKEAKRDAKNGTGKVNHQKRDPGIPNSWPFKQDLLKDIQRARERQQQQQQEQKDKRKEELRLFREHQEQGGSCRTVEELMARATQDRQAFDAKQTNGTEGNDDTTDRSDGKVAAGQQSRRAYLRELKKVVDTADVLLQVLDARDPIGSRIHQTLEDVILSKADKRMVLVLNKIDLVPKEVVGRWLTVLRRSHPTIAIKASKDLGASTGDEADATNSSMPMGMDGLLQLLKNYARTGGVGGKSKTTIVVGVIGYPNVGKSSIINALKRSRAVGVSARPGFTTSMQEVVLDRNVRLLDSPGVVFDDNTALLGNCVDAESIEDPIPPVDALLRRCNPQSLIMTYNIPAFPQGDTMMFLAMVAKSYGRVLKGGIPDKLGAARAVLKDWNQGKIPYYTVPPRDAEPDVSKGGAVIVSSFGAEFDLSKYDDQVLNSLKESDEMDFVQLENEGDSSAVAQESRVLANYLNKEGDDDSDEDMSEDEDGEDEDDEMEEENFATRSKLAQAEDFDFSTM